MRAVLLVLLLVLATPGRGETPAPYSGTVTVGTAKPFLPYVDALGAAIQENGFNIVGLACADCAIRGAFKETVPGNQVFLFFRPDYARRMLQASTAAGIEAPIRLYVTEAADGSALVTYRLPSHVFGAYDVDALTVLGNELDSRVEDILQTAAKAF
jgi:uncharacterized protein (DUF302 family)